MSRAIGVPLTPFFLHYIRLKPEAPYIHRARTNELEYPFRESNSLVLNLWRGRGLVLGRWRPTGRDETEGLLAATGGREDALNTAFIRDHTRRFDWESDDLLT